MNSIEIVPTSSLTVWFVIGFFNMLTLMFGSAAIRAIPPRAQLQERVN